MTVNGRLIWRKNRRVGRLKRPVQVGWKRSGKQTNEIHTKQGVCHTVALPFTFKSILMQKKNYGNSNISPCKNVIFQKSSKRNQNPSIYYNSITNLKFQDKPKYPLSEILI
jgi:hypothetical protein